METNITRPIDTEGRLGFDERGQLLAYWDTGDGDGSYCSTVVPDLRHQFCALCKRGWPSNAEAFRDHYFVNNVFRFVHKTCWAGHLTLAECDMWQGLLIAGGFVLFEIRTIPNEYRGGWNLPWYEVSFTGYIPKMKLGRRKNVYHLSMHDLSDKQVLLASELFKKITSTNWSNTGNHEAGAHAWDEAEAKRHLERLRVVLMLDQPFKKAAEHGK